MTERRSDEELETIFYHGTGVTGTEAGGLRAVYAAGVADTAIDREALAKAIHDNIWSVHDTETREGRKPIAREIYYRKADEALSVLALVMGGECTDG